MKRQSWLWCDLISSALGASIGRSPDSHLTWNQSPETTVALACDWIPINLTRVFPLNTESWRDGCSYTREWILYPFIYIILRQSFVPIRSGSTTKYIPVPLNDRESSALFIWVFIAAGRNLSQNCICTLPPTKASVPLSCYSAQFFVFSYEQIILVLAYIYI